MGIQLKEIMMKILVVANLDITNKILWGMAVRVRLLSSNF